MARTIGRRAIRKSGFTAEMRAINERLVVSAVREQELAESAQRTEQRLRDLMRGLGAVVCEIDIETGKTNFLSVPGDALLGRLAEDWRAEPSFLEAIVHPDDRESMAHTIKTFSGIRHEYEYEFRALSGEREPIWMRNIVRPVRDANGHQTLMRCLIVDVTAEKQISQALEAAYSRERGIAEALQRSLLFRPRDDTFPGLDVSSLYEPASDGALVGGDFSDAFACDHGNVALVLGDVMGHGLAAAMSTAELKFTVRGFVREHVHAGRVLEQMNTHICECSRLFNEGLNDLGNADPLALTVATINTATGRGAIAISGMEPAIIVRKCGDIETIDSGGLLIGVLPDEQYSETPLHLEPGDRLMAVTDGITEARRGHRFFGFDGFIEAVRRSAPDATLDDMTRSVFNTVHDFAGGAMFDDACIIAAQRH